MANQLWHYGVQGMKWGQRKAMYNRMRNIGYGEKNLKKIRAHNRRMQYLGFAKKEQQIHAGLNAVKTARGLVRPGFNGSQKAQIAASGALNVGTNLGLAKGYQVLRDHRSKKWESGIGKYRRENIKTELSNREIKRYLMNKNKNVRR